MNSDPVAIARSFVDAINRRNVDEIAGLMPEDHLFVDSDGAEIKGARRMRSGWERYFQLFPDYTIRIEETYSRGPVVVMLGAAEGTYAAGGELLAENRWSIPAVWRAVVRGRAVLEWRVYANVETVANIMAGNRKQTSRKRSS